MLGYLSSCLELVISASFHCNMKALLVSPATWEALAPCREDPDAWFPGKGGNGNNERPLAICGGCPVKQQCLDKALSFPTHQDRGIWGATTEMQRREIRVGRLTVEQAWAGQGRLSPSSVAQRERAKAARLANMQKGADLRRTRTHCPHGHEYNEGNTALTPDGRRQCRACRALRSAAWRARQAPAQDAA